MSTPEKWILSIQNGAFVVLDAKSQIVSRSTVDERAVRDALAIAAQRKVAVEIVGSFSVRI